MTSPNVKSKRSKPAAPSLLPARYSPSVTYEITDCQEGKRTVTVRNEAELKLKHLASDDLGYKVIARYSITPTEQLKDLLKARGFRSMGDTVMPIFKRVKTKGRRSTIDEFVFRGGGWVSWYHKFNDSAMGWFLINQRVPELKQTLENKFASY